MKCLLIFSVALLACLVFKETNGAAFYHPGPCPDNYTVGEEWYDGCVRCSCDHMGYMCAGCGLVADVIGCELIHDINATWPECCPRVECPVFEVGR